MVCLERLPVLTARSILEFIKSIRSGSAKKGKGWFSNYSEQLKETNRIHTDLEKNRQETFNKLTIKKDWINLNTSIFQAEMNIRHKFELMKTILTNEDRQDTSEVERLQSGILDFNNGVLSNLSVIHQGLVGQIVTHPTEKGLLEMWSMGLCDIMKINFMSAKRYQSHVDKYLDDAAILQFKGILLFTEANTNFRFCSQQLDLFEKNLEYQIRKKQETVPTYMKYLTDPDEKKGFFLRPVFDGKDEPFVRSRGLKKRIGYDYMCGYTEEGQWFFEKSPNFEKDGSLLISGSFNGVKCNYISVSEKNKAECVSLNHLATPFDVIPLDFSDNKLKIIIRKSNAKPDERPFLGSNLTFIDESDDTEFNLFFDHVSQ